MSCLISFFLYGGIFELLFVRWNHFYSHQTLDGTRSTQKGGRTCPVTTTDEFRTVGNNLCCAILAIFGSITTFIEIVRRHFKFKIQRSLWVQWNFLAIFFSIKRVIADFKYAFLLQRGTINQFAIGRVQSTRPNFWLLEIFSLHSIFRYILTGSIHARSYCELEWSSSWAACHFR